MLATGYDSYDGVPSQEKKNPRKENRSDGGPSSPVGAVGARGAVGTTPPRGRAVQVVVRGRAEDNQPEETQAADFPA